MKRILSVLLIISVSLCLFAGGDQEETNVITVWSQAAADSSEGQMFQKTVDDFNANNTTGYTVVLENITRSGAGSGYIDKLNAAIAAGNMPDIFTLDGPDVAAYANNGVIQPVNSIVGDDFIAGFTPAIIEQGTVNGEMYALGYTDSACTIAFNKAVIEHLPDDIKALIPSPDEDWTWQDYLEVSRGIEALRTNPDTKDIPAIAQLDVACDWLTSDINSGAYETGTYFLTPILWSNGGNLIADDGITLDGYFNSAQNIEALMLVAQFFAEGLVLPVEPQKAFYNGRAGSCIFGFWFANEISNNYPDLDYYSVRMPKFRADFDGAYTPSGSWTFVCSSSVDTSSEKGKAVGEVLKALTGDDATRYYWNFGQYIPTRVASLDAISDTAYDERTNNAWHVMKYEIENTNKARPVTQGYPVLSELWARDVLLAIGQRKVTSQADITKIVNDAMAKIQREYDRF